MEGIRREGIIAVEGLVHCSGWTPYLSVLSRQQAMSDGSTSRRAVCPPKFSFNSALLAQPSALVNVVPQPACDSGRHLYIAPLHYSNRICTWGRPTERKRARVVWIGLDLASAITTPPLGLSGRSRSHFPDIRLGQRRRIWPR
jgi:hypothetical protein